jgi:hypothetical protein
MTHKQELISRILFGVLLVLFVIAIIISIPYNPPKSTTYKTICLESKALTSVQPIGHRYKTSYYITWDGGAAEVEDDPPPLVGQMHCIRTEKRYDL